MEFLESIDKRYYYIFFGIIFIIGHFIVQRKDDLKLSLKYYLFSYGIVILLFSSSLPYVFRGYPHNVSDLDDKKMLLYHLQENNDALAETIRAVRKMASITFVFIVVIIINVIRHLKIEKSAK